MHPPFGFALFYLRSVAPAQQYLDRVTGRLMAPVTTTQNYWGAIPFVVIQLVMVALLIVFPQMSLVYKSGAPEIDSSKVKIEIPADN
jgi:TRAP-type mannitol/chloroaromatic compound transport system permease large subunit